MDRVQLSDIERGVVVGVSNKLTGAKARWSDARNALEDATKAVELADAAAQAAISTLIAIRELDGNWTPSPDGRELVKVG